MDHNSFNSIFNDSVDILYLIMSNLTTGDRFDVLVQISSNPISNDSDDILNLIRSYLLQNNETFAEQLYLQLFFFLIFNSFILPILLLILDFNLQCALEQVFKT